jgi:hypothetical protein
VDNGIEAFQITPLDIADVFLYRPNPDLLFAERAPLK